jgi:hypothetical protein
MHAAAHQSRSSNGRRGGRSENYMFSLMLARS